MIRLPASDGSPDSLPGIHHQGPERHRQVVVVDELLGLEMQFAHGVILPPS